jgi:hypothetical protein
MENITLPTEPGVAVTFWTSEDDGNEITRGTLTLDADGRWSISFDLGYDDGEGMHWDDGAGSFSPADLERFVLTLAKAFAAECNRVHADFLDVMTKGRSEFPTARKHVTIVRGRGGFNVRLVPQFSDSWGRPYVSMVAKRALSAEECFVLTRRFAMALDWYRQREGE